MEASDKLKYPIGRLSLPDQIDQQQIDAWIDNLENFPDKLREVAENLSEAELETPYRPGSWTARQTIHHLADSHMNSYIRFKWALTEDNPIIKGYNEAVWADMKDSKTADTDASLKMIEGIHARWVALLRGLTMEELKSTFYHPEFDKTMRLDRMVGLYSWHGDHHLAHIENAKDSASE
jgi:hypothetical protein